MRYVLTLACVAFAVQSAAAQDVLKFHDPGHPDYSGTLISFTYKSVEIEMLIGGTLARQQVPIREIREIEFDPAQKSSEYYAGENAMNQGNYTQAAERFEKAMSAPRTSDIMRQAAAFNFAHCSFLAGDAAKALATAQSIRKEKPETFYLRETYDLEYRCNLSRRDLNAANKTLLALEQKAGELKMPEWGRSADFMRADLLEMQDKWREALAIHRKYLNDRDAAADARLGELRCLARLKDWPGVKSRAESVLSAAKGTAKTSERLLTAAHNAMGDVELQAGNIKDGFLHFLQGALVLNKGGESCPEHEAALAGAARACARMASTMKDKAQKDEYARRAKELLGDLDKAYPGSPLHQEATQAIQEIK